jgi:hypothetical protein
LLGLLGCRAEAEEALAVTQAALEAAPDATGVDSGPEALPPTDRSAWLPTEVGLSDVVIPAALAEVDRRRAAARSAVERVEARERVYAEASRALEEGAEPLEVRRRTAIALRMDLMGSDEAISDFLAATAEQQRAGTEPRPTEGDLESERELPAELRALLEENERHNQRLDEATRAHPPDDPRDDAPGLPDLMWEAARRGPPEEVRRAR